MHSIDSVARYPWDGVGASRLWSFAEMIDIAAPFITNIFSAFATIQQSLRSDGGGPAELHPEMKPKYARLSCLVGIQHLKSIFDDDDLQTRIWRLQCQLEGGEPFTGDMLARELEGLHTQAIICLSKHKFAYIPSPGDKYLEQEGLFGEEVYERIPEAREDIKNAGNSLAAELHAAAVFYLMRAAEHGLRHIARRMRVTRIIGKKPVDISETTWENLLREIRKKLEAAHQEKNITAMRSKRIALYSDAADHAKHMQGLWRNGVSHLEVYNIYEAMNIFDRVKGFMQLIARGFA